MLTATMTQPPPPADRAPPPDHLVTGLVLELADAAAFQSLCERQRLRHRRDGQPLLALRLQVSVEAPVDARLVDPVLEECARRLRSRLRASDTMARWQGSQVGVLLPRCSTPQAEAVLRRLTEGASGPYRLGAELLRLQLRGTLVRPDAPAAD